VSLVGLAQFAKVALVSSLLSQTEKHPRQRWIRVNQLPFSRGYTYKLLAIGALESVLVQSLGSKKGVRLIDGDSLDRYLEKLAAEQKEVVK
jgi:hypothetical protein